RSRRRALRRPPSAGGGCRARAARAGVPWRPRESRSQIAPWRGGTTPPPGAPLAIGTRRRRARRPSPTGSLCCRPPPVRCALALALVLSAAAVPASAALPDDVRGALDRMLACERPEGGWTYSCPPRGPNGAVTWPLLRARRIAALFGRDGWDVVVLRS